MAAGSAVAKENHRFAGAAADGSVEADAAGTSLEAVKAGASGAATLLGRLGEYASEAERRQVREMREELSAELDAAPAFPELVGDRRLLRTLRANRHQVAEAAAAFRVHLQKRRDFGLDAVREHIAHAWGAHLASLPPQELPGGDVVVSYVPQVMPFARTPHGDPISVQFWGLWRTGEFVREVEEWRDVFRVHACYQLEFRAMLVDRLSEQQGRLVRIVNVNDLKNWSMMSHLDSTFISFQREEMLPLASTYHDLCSCVFFINTSRWFHIPYGIFYPLLPRHTQEKITLLGEDFGDSPRLLEELGPEVAAALARPAVGPPRALRASRVAAAAARGPSPDGAPAEGSRRAYFGLAVARGGAEVELQSWLHSAVIEPLASRQVLSEFRVLWAASFSAATSSTFVVFELSAPQPWLSLEDPEICQWRRCLEAAGIRLVGPKSTAAEVTHQVHAGVEPAKASGRPERRSWNGLLWLSALEVFGGEILVGLAMHLLLVWVLLRAPQQPGAA